MRTYSQYLNELEHHGSDSTGKLNESHEDALSFHKEKKRLGDVNAIERVSLKKKKPNSDYHHAMATYHYAKSFEGSSAEGIVHHNKAKDHWAKADALS